MMKNFKVLLFYGNATLHGAAPINLALLSACLKNDGFDVKLFDCTMYKQSDGETMDDIRAKLGHVKKTRLEDYVKLKTEDIYKDFIKTIDEYRPNLIGFSVIEGTIDYSLTFAERIKDKGIPIIFGGVGATFAYKKILDTNLTDFVCVGEGEEALVELCNKLNNNEDCSAIKNIYLKDKNGNIIKNPIRPLIKLETLPVPDFSIFDYDRFYRPFFGNIIRMMKIDSDRGCPFVCTYCAAPSLKGLYKENHFNNYYRMQDMDKVIEEIHIAIKNYDINFISFGAEDFLSIPIQKFRHLAERYINEIHLPFTCQTRLDRFTEEKTRLLAEMGCKSVVVGFEHGSEQIRLELLGKKLSNAEAIKGVEELNKYDIFPVINNMIGLPDETRENIFETVEMNRHFFNILKKKYTLNVFIFAPYSGTRLRQLCIDKRYITGDEPFSLSEFTGSILTMPSISKEEIKGLEKTLTLYIMLPKSYWSDIKIAEQDNEEGDMMFNKLMKIKNELLETL